MQSTRQFAGLIGLLSVCSMLLPGQGIAQELPVPVEAELEAAIGVVKDVFGEEYAAAKSNVQKQSLVRKMLDTVAGTKDPIDRFALLQVARGIATEAGDGVNAFRAVDEMAQWFRIDAVQMKAAVLYELSKKAQTLAHHKSVAQQSFRLADEAIRGDDVHTALRLADLALAESRKARDSEIGKQIVAWKKEFDEVVQAFEKAKLGLEKLESAPADATANLDVGRYACFVKGDWQNGLMMLALGDDPQLKQIAIREIGPPLDAAQRAEVGDAWWELAERTEGLGKSAMHARAAYHYRLAVPHAAGLLGVKLKKRLAQLAQEDAQAYRDAEQMARRPVSPSPAATRTAPGSAAPAGDPAKPPPSTTADARLPVPATGPPEPKAPRVDLTPGRSPAFARVSMSSITPMALVEGVKMHKNYALSNIPKSLSNGFVILKGGNVRGNTTRFSVRTDGLVYLLMSGRPGGGGGGGPWQKQIIKPAQLEAAGWRLVGKINYRGNPPSGLYARTCKRGESFEMSWEKYIPPALIAPVGFVD